MTGLQAGQVEEPRDAGADVEQARVGAADRADGEYAERLRNARIEEARRKAVAGRVEEAGAAAVDQAASGTVVEARRSVAGVFEARVPKAAIGIARVPGARVEVARVSEAGVPLARVADAR
ncbi:hypothetical protein [Mycobacterium sp. E2699]|uniref:hypothetical protein n=1 Tax=Mycobacterium sp. E2699 TaxID=1834137 RepID=UPI0012E994BD|nr:hypothetical protein [Mycobacterium sp. E2699]